MLSRFLLTLAFSWSITPMWVALAHWRGFGADPILQTLLLTQGACVPFQLLLNECLAVGQVRSGRAPSMWVIMLVLGAQVLTCLLTLSALDGLQTMAASTVLSFALACAVSNFVSYKVASVYYNAVLNGRVTRRESAWIGGIPGLSMLLLYSLFFEARAQNIVQTPGVLALLIPFAPLLQWLFIRHICKHEWNGFDASGPSGGTPPLMTAAVTVALMIISGMITRYRDEFSGMAPAYGALILVALNTFASITNAVTRARFLELGLRLHQVLAKLGFLFCGGSWALFVMELPVLSSLIALLGLQLLMIAAIEYARGLLAPVDETEAFGQGHS